MSVDFKAEVEKRRDAMMSDLFDLLSIKSEREDDLATETEPFGPGPVRALEHFLEMAERDGYQTRNIDNYAGQFEYGEGDETLGIFAHLDVVPAGDGWDTDPYTPVIKDGKLYARGSSDDKGPTMACYYALKIIKELELPVSKKVRFIVGTDEESGWADMDYYFEHSGEAKPDFGFSPDAEFPIINGEKGNITAYLHFPTTNEGAYQLRSFTGGQRENMVPDSATAVFTAPVAREILEAQFIRFSGEQNIIGKVEEAGDAFQIKVFGKSAHGMSPQAGVNAATYLALFLSQFEFQAGAAAFLNQLATTIHLDFYGQKLGVAYTDAKMGELTMNAGVIRFDIANDDATVALNFRYPQGTTPEALRDQLTRLEGVASVTLSDKGHTPHYVPVDDPMVKTLLDVYEKHTGLKGHEQIIGGGTFGRLLKRGVAYGAMFPGYVNTMHQANEFADVEDLYRAAVIYAEAIYELIK